MSQAENYVVNTIESQFSKHGKGDVHVTVRVGIDGSVYIAFTVTNRHVFKRLRVHSTIKVGIDQKTVYSYTFSQAVDSRLAGFFNRHGHKLQFNTRDAFDPMVFDGIEVDVSSDPSLKDFDEQIMILGKSVRQKRILYGENSDEYKNVVNQLNIVRDQRSTLHSDLIDNAKLQNVVVTCDITTVPV